MRSRESIISYLSKFQFELKLLVLDIDGCTYLGPHSHRADGLNQSLIDRAQNYDAVVFVTHRAFWTYQLGVFKNALIGSKTWLTQKVVKNFLRSTGLFCLGVSSPDDVGTEFGQAFRGFINVTDYVAANPLAMPRHFMSKNPQLKQVIDFIYSINPMLRLKLDFFDDHLYLLRSAHDITIEYGETVLELNCFLTTNEVIEPVEQITPDPASSSPCCRCSCLIQ